MNYTRKVAFNTAVQIGGRVVGMGLSLVTVAALFRYLGVEGVGKYTTAFAFVAFFAVFADFGLGWTMLRELSVNKDKNKVFKNLFTLRLILGLTIHLISAVSVWFFNYDYDVKMGVVIINIAWLFQTMNLSIVQVFLNNYHLEISVVAELIGRTIILAAVYLLIHFNYSFSWIMSAYIIGNIINFAIDLYYGRRFVQIGFGFDKVYLKRAIRQAIPIGIVLIFGFIYYKIDSLLLSMMKGMVDVGIYGAPYKLLEVLQAFPSLFLGAAFPLITKYVVTKDERVIPAFQKQFDFLTLMSIPTVIATFLLASPLIQFIAGSRGDEFINTSTVSIFGSPLTSVTCLKILIISVGINFVTALYNYMIISLGRQKSMIVPTIIFAVFNLSLNLILIPRYSYFGAAIATLLTEVIVAFTNYYIANSFVRLPIKLTGFFKVVLAGAIMGVVIYMLTLFKVPLLLNIISAGIIYIGLVLAFKAVPLDVVRQMIRKSE